MCIHVNTYELLVDNIGEANAYQLCEKLGGIELKIPKKAHRTYRIRQIITKALPLIKENPQKRTTLTKRLSRLQEITPDMVRKIIREVEYGK